MKVSELIRKLEKLPQDLPVKFEYHDSDEGLMRVYLTNVEAYKVGKRFSCDESAVVLIGE